MKPTLKAVIVCLFFSAALVFAQSTDATVSGTVADPSGAHVVNVTVTAFNIDTGIATTVQTNESGVYVFAALPPGNYRVSAAHPGFRKSTINDVVIQVGARLTLNLTLELGATTETVEVQATAATLNTSNASVGDVITGTKLLGLPLAGRSSYDLIVTQPGVVQGGGYNINGN